jgi:hypothetical protein
MNADIWTQRYFAGYARSDAWQGTQGFLRLSINEGFFCSCEPSIALSLVKAKRELKSRAGHDPH